MNFYICTVTVWASQDIDINDIYSDDPTRRRGDEPATAVSLSVVTGVVRTGDTPVYSNDITATPHT